MPTATNRRQRTPLAIVIVVVIAAVVLGLLILFVTSRGRGELGSSAVLRPDRFGFVQDGRDVVIIDGPEQRAVWSLDASVATGDALRIESIEATGQNEVLVGTCCEPADGRQFVLDTETGRVEVLPLTFRFPSVDSLFDVVVSGGTSIEVENLGSLLAYENGVGVVAPGPTLREATGSKALQPVLLPDERVAFVDAGILTLVDFDGVVLAEIPAPGIVFLEFDARNNMLIAAVTSEGNEAAEADELRLYSPDDLEGATERTLDQPITSFDVADGWLLLSNADSSISTSRIDDLDTPVELLIERGAGIARWLPAEAVNAESD